MNKEEADSRMNDEESEEGECIPITLDFGENDGSKRKRDEKGDNYVLDSGNVKNLQCKRLKDFDKVTIEFEITPEQAQKIYEEEMAKKQREKERPGIGGRELLPQAFFNEDDYEIIRKETDYITNTPIEDKVPWKMNVWEVINTDKIPDYLKQKILMGETVYINDEAYRWPGVKCCAMVSNPVKLK